MIWPSSCSASRDGQVHLTNASIVGEETSSSAGESNTFCLCSAGLLSTLAWSPAVEATSKEEDLTLKKLMSLHVPPDWT